MNRNVQAKLLRYKWRFVALAVCMALVGGGIWLAGSLSGLQWLAGAVERQNEGRLRITTMNGTLLSSFGMQGLVWLDDDWRVTLKDVQLQWQPTALLSGELRVLRLEAGHVEVLSLPSDTPLVLPDSLSVPLRLNLLQLKVGTLDVAGSEVAEPDFSVSNIETSLRGDGQHIEWQTLSARLEYGDLTGSGELGLNRPYVIKAQAVLDAEPDISGKSERAHLRAVVDGYLDRINVRLDGHVAGARIDGNIQLVPLADVTISRLQIAFDEMEAARLLDGVPPATLSGSVDLHGTPGNGLEGTLQVRNAHAAPLDRNGLPVLAAAAQLAWHSSRWQLSQLDARLLGNARLTGAASWETQRNKLNAQFKVHALDPAALDTRSPGAHLQGDITLGGEGNKQRAVVMLSDGTLELFGELQRNGKLVELTRARLARGEIALTGHGQLALDRRRTFRLFGQLRKLNLSEFAAIPSTDLNAELRVSGALLPEAQGVAKIDLTDSHFAGQNFSGKVSLEFIGTRRARAGIDARLGDNRLNLNFAHGTDADRAQLVLDAPNLEQLGFGLGGRLTGRVDLSGSFAEPRLQFAVQGADLALPDGQRVAVLDTTGDLASPAMGFNLSVKDYRAKGALTLPEAKVDLHGSRGQHTVQVSARMANNEVVLGDLILRANGGLSDPMLGWQSLQWQGTLDELAAQGVLPFHLLAAIPLALSRDSFHLGTADVAVGGGQLQFSDTRWTPQHWRSAGHFNGLNVRAINTQQNKFVSGALDAISFGGAWEVEANKRLQGWLQLQRESGDWVVDSSTGLRLGLQDMQLTLGAEQDQLFAHLGAHGERLGEIEVLANIPMSYVDADWTILPEAPLAGHLRLRSDDLSWLGPVLDSNLQSGGQLNFDADLTGTARSPRLRGTAHGRGLSLALLDQGIRLEQGEMKTRFESDAVHVDRFAFSAPYLASPRDKLLADFALPAGAGQLSASGLIDLAGGSGDLKITAEHLPLAQRADRWIIASGTGHARYANKTLILDGNIRADAGLINQPVSDRPRWSEDVQIIGLESAGRAGPPNLVDATLDLGDHFYIRASGFEGRLAGQLKVYGEPAEPLRVTGTIAAQDALFDAYGQRLQVERGMVNFQGPLDDPGLNILAVRKGLEIEAGVEVTGTVRRPEVRLVSTPNVPDGEKLSWIVLGRVPESSDVDTSLLLAAASNILGGRSVGELSQTFGVDEISLSQKTGADATQSQKVTVGKRLSSRARISYEQGLSEVGGVTKFVYALTPRITIVTRTGVEDALDLFYTLRFY